jgi:hypothetical protein
MPVFKDRYSVVYPLREYGFNRAKCGQVIRDAGLPLPPKSACFFCPAMRTNEIERLAIVDPDYYRLAIEMEAMYRGGHHFRGEDTWTVKGKHRQTAEIYKLEVQAKNAAEARAKFRSVYNDTASPFQYQLSTYQAVPGLGRNFAWKDVSVQLPVLELR